MNVRSTAGERGGRRCAHNELDEYYYYEISSIYTQTLASCVNDDDIIYIGGRLGYVLV